MISCGQCSSSVSLTTFVCSVCCKIATVGNSTDVQSMLISFVAFAKPGGGYSPCRLLAAVTTILSRSWVPQQCRCMCKGGLQCLLFHKLLQSCCVCHNQKLYVPLCMAGEFLACGPVFGVFESEMRFHDGYYLLHQRM